MSDTPEKQSTQHKHIPSELEFEKRDLAERFAHRYTASPLDLVPHPSPQLVESTVEVIVPTPHGNFGVRAWRFADGAEHMSIRALDTQGNPIAFS